MKTFTLADVFCGVGMVSEGFKRAGFQPVWACEKDVDASLAYEEHHGLWPAGDIAGVEPEKVPDIDVLAAGLPCQAFSPVGLKRGWADPREHVLHGLLRIVSRRRPRVVVVENVLGFLHRPRPYKLVRNWLRAMGYRVSAGVLNATDFGSAAHRPRAFLVGHRGGRKLDFGAIPTTKSRGRLRDILEPSGPGMKWLDPSEYVLLDGTLEPTRHGLVFAGYRRQERLKRPGGNLRQSRTHHEMARIYSADGVGPCILTQSGRYWIHLGPGLGVRWITETEGKRALGVPDSWQVTRRQLGNGAHVGTVQALALAIREQLLDI
jgi:DNA (cytosine-5)-methyltransferase 1